MSDKIMPMTEAVEGYDLFDKMKVQKGGHLFYCKKGGVLTNDSDFRSTGIAYQRVEKKFRGLLQYHRSVPKYILPQDRVSCGLDSKEGGAEVNRRVQQLACHATLMPPRRLTKFLPELPKDI